MVDVILEFENASDYLPILKINLLFVKSMEERKLMGFILEFIKLNKLDIISFGENQYPNIYSDYPLGVAIFARFTNWGEAVKFTKETKIP